jgi:hypothetical protein
VNGTVNPARKLTSTSICALCKEDEINHCFTSHTAKNGEAPVGEMGDSAEKHSLNSSAPLRERLEEPSEGSSPRFVLEADLEPDVFTERRLRAMLGTSFDGLLGLRIKAQT